MRYQQIFAEFKIKQMLDVGGKRGVIWHTQGSGKTALAKMTATIFGNPREFIRTFGATEKIAKI